MATSTEYHEPHNNRKDGKVVRPPTLTPTPPTIQPLTPRRNQTQLMGEIVGEGGEGEWVEGRDGESRPWIRKGLKGGD